MPAKNVTITANYTIRQYTVSAAPDNPSYGTVTGSGTYNCGSTATVTTSAATNYIFVGWYDEDGNQVSTATTYTFTVYDNHTLEARFVTNITIAFARNSVAYTSNGAQVGVNVPRFEQGKFDKAIMIEDGTTNLLPANKANCEVAPDTIAYAAVTVDTSRKLVGSGSLKVQWDGSGGYAYAEYKITLTNGNTYTVSGWVYAEESKYLRLSVQEIASPWRTLNTDLVLIPAKQWTRLSVTFTLPSDWKQPSRIQLHPPRNSTTFSDFATIPVWWDAIQVEQKPYTTSFIVGTRSPETLTIPNANVFNKSNWNLEFQFDPTSNQVVSNKTGYLWENYIDANNYYALKVGSDGKPYLEVKSNGTIYQTSTAAAPVLNVGTWYDIKDIKIRGNGSLMAIAVNGTKISEVSYVEPVGNLPANMYIGSDHNGSNHANGLFDDIRISAIARSDTEWTNAYASGQPLPVDEWTTLKVDFNGDLSTQRGVIP